MPADHPEDAILRSWKRNAEPWTRAVRDGRIRSRVEVTNAAIRDAVLELAPRTVLDLGCGEGWLVRALVAAGIDARGVDAVEDLVLHAAELGGPDRYRVASFDDIGQRPEDFGPVDVVVANFSLLGERSTADAVGAVPRLLHAGGHFLVQTVHPFTAPPPVKSGWRSGSWEGFGEEFEDASPWYFRTVADWVVLFSEAGLSLVSFDEPRGPAPSSLLFHTRRR